MVTGIVHSKKCFNLFSYLHLKISVSGGRFLWAVDIILVLGLSLFYSEE